jgi:hypothetical protein
MIEPQKGGGVWWQPWLLRAAVVETVLALGTATAACVLQILANFLMHSGDRFTPPHRTLALVTATVTDTGQLSFMHSGARFMPPQNTLHL